MPVPIVIAVAAFVSACIALDVHERRIPNALSGSAMFVGAAVNALYFGAPGAVTSVVGLAVGGVLLLGPCALGGVGAGDVKMMGAVGALVGPRLVLIGGLVGMMLGGVVMAIHLLRIGRLGEIVERLRHMIAGVVQSRSIAPLRASAADPDAVTLPYSVPLGVGTVLVLLWAGR